MLKKLDVIIPAYNSHETLDRCIASIIMQTIKDQVTITVVNDLSEKPYQEFINKYNSIVDIREIKCPINGGPGYARQYGLNHTHNEFVTFIDADDTFANSFSLSLLMEYFKDTNNAVVVGSFMEECENSKFVLHDFDYVWMFGKIFRRKFLNKYDIKFNNLSRANEDAGFNKLVKLFANENEQIHYTQEIVYYWHFKENSITRINNSQYTYDQSFCGYANNMIWAIKHAKSQKANNSLVLETSILSMVDLYFYFIDTYHNDIRYIEQNWEWCKLYYKEIYKDLDLIIEKHIVENLYTQFVKGAGLYKFVNIPHLTFYQFVDKLREEYLNINYQILGPEFEYGYNT